MSDERLGSSDSHDWPDSLLGVGWTVEVVVGDEQEPIEVAAFDWEARP